MKRFTKKQIRTSKTKAALNNTEETSVNKIRIMNFLFLLNIFGIVPPNNAMPFVRLLYKIFITGIFILFMFSMLGQLMAVYVYWGDIPVISIIISHLSGVILGSITCGYFLHSKDKLMSLIDLLRMQFVSRMKSKYIELIHVAERQVKTFVILSVSNIILCAAVWVGKPLIKIYNFEKNNGTTEVHDLERFIFVIWAPFEIYDSPQFEIIMVLQIFASTFLALTLFAVDVIFLSLMSHAAAQFKFLCALLNNMAENVSEDELNRTKRKSLLNDIADSNLIKDPLTSADDTVCRHSRSGHSRNHKSETACPENGQMGEDPFRLYLVQCIKHHRATTEFVDYLNKIMSEITFFKTLTFPFLLCMTGFQMMQNYKNLDQFVKFASLFIGAITLIATYCWFGQQVIDEGDKVQLAFYSTDWYNQTPGFKSMLPLAIMRASRPVTVKAGVFFDMSFLTLASLVNVSYRFMTMLIQLYDS